MITGKYLLKNGRPADLDGLKREDLAIGSGIIQARGYLDPADFPGFSVVDVGGKLLFPGGIDPHVHLALPTPAGNSCDDFVSGSRAALAGGTTTIFDFVTPVRGQSLYKALALRRIESAHSKVNCFLHMGISEWNAKVASELASLLGTGGIGSVKAYLAYRDTIGIRLHELKEVMELASRTGTPVMVHCEDGDTIHSLQLKYRSEGKLEPVWHSRSRPPEAEIRAIEQVMELALVTGCTVYIVHISTRKGAAIVGTAKKSGIRVFGETCPQYLLLDQSVYAGGTIPEVNQGIKNGTDDREKDQNSYRILPFIISPPLRTREDQEGLWEALADGTLDVVATDHCPFSLYGQKDAGLYDFTKIPNGAGGIEHRLPLLYTYGVLQHRISLKRLSDLISANPADIFGLGDRKGKLHPGYDADIVIWDPDIQKVISVENHQSDCDSEIYEGFRIRGQVDRCFILPQ